MWQGPEQLAIANKFCILINQFNLTMGHQFRKSKIAVYCTISMANGSFELAMKTPKRGELGGEKGGKKTPILFVKLLLSNDFLNLVRKIQLMNLTFFILEKY